MALSIFASGVFIEVFENLQAKLTTMNGRLDGAEYDAMYTPIVYIGWLSRFSFKFNAYSFFDTFLYHSALGVFSGIGLCCLAASMYEQYDRSNNKQFKAPRFVHLYICTK